jgi:lipopolysaccharide exporter
MSESLKTTTFRNVGYNSFATVIQMVIMAAANIIMTRTLAPSDYGIVGFACIFTAFLSQFSDLGISSAVIQRKELDPRELYTAFTIKFIIGMIIFILAFLGAPLAVQFFDNPAITWVIRILALNFLINTFAILPNTLLIRGLDYKRIAIANLVSVLLNSAVAVTLALMGFKYWSLVFALLVMSLSTSVMMNYLRPVRYCFAFSREAANRFIRFGANVFLSGLICFLVFNADNFLVGSMMGATNLGYYNLAFNWGSIACTMIASIVLSVLFPTFCKMKENRKLLKNSYLMVLQYISFGGVMLNMILFVVSRDFLFLVLGHNTDKWLPSLAALRILCFYGILRLLLEPVGQVVMALARTDVLRNANLLVAGIELAGLYPAIHFLGIEGVALLVTLAYAAQYPLYYRVLRVELNASFTDLCSCIMPALLGMLALGLAFIIFPIHTSISFPFFVVKILFCIAIYIMTFGFATNWRLYKDMRSLAISHIRMTVCQTK